MVVVEPGKIKKTHVQNVFYPSPRGKKVGA
jgi:hypothetical protein